GSLEMYLALHDKRGALSDGMQLVDEERVVMPFYLPQPDLVAGDGELVDHMAFDVVALEYSGHAMLHDQAHSFDGGEYLRPMGVVGVDVSHGHNGGAHDDCGLHFDHSILLSSCMWQGRDREP